MPSIQFSRWPTAIEAGSGTILEAALRAGVPHPNECRVGECGSCKARLLAGPLDMEEDTAALLAPEERAQGYFLACRARPRGDVRVDWVNDEVRSLRARILSIEDACPDVKVVRLEPEAPLAFTAGQYARLRFRRLPFRSYSMANRPDEGTLEFHVRLRRDGLVSGHLATEARPGDVVRVEGPHGTAALRGARRPILAVAGGTGWAPIRSIVRTALAAGGTAPIHLYLAFRSEGHVYGEAEWSELAARHPNLECQVILGSGQGDRRGGPVHEAIAEDMPDLGSHDVYVAGSARMVEAVRQSALSCGAAPGDVFSDAFTPAPEAPDGPVPDGGGGLWASTLQWLGIGRLA